MSGPVGSLLGRTERSSPKAAQRRAEGAGLDREGACQATIGSAAMSLSWSSRRPRKTGAELDGKLAHGGGPIDRSPPAQAGILDREVEQLQRRIVVRELPRVLMILRSDRCSASTALVV